MFDDPSVPRLDCAGRVLVLDRPRIMGIVNVTPDSFSDGGRLDTPEAAIAHGLALVEAGADLLDVGGESTRPGAQDVSGDDELARVLPVIEGLLARTSVPVSVDTSKAPVMRAALAAGAGLVNDVYALRREGALEAVAEAGVPVVLMHMQGEPRSMQEAPEYHDVVAEVHAFLAQRVFACEMAGIPKSRLVLDPGFGFGKTLEHNLALLARLDRFGDLGCPVLAGLSRKRMIGELTGREVDDRIAGSTAAALIAVQRGARILRVHDVAATRDMLQVWVAVDGQPLPRVSKASAAPRWPDDE
ncbi:dihydropteroate synthase [Alkalisalibacterium limincola]|uniref:Dihydropteroate synthase n=1 Tax=Alkalisalibacterium limincola TaxID=2699169 RepID=A0A5C8KZS8_9GAMM|nr:dihydropteroate synthase [Alkalisalibacterium limincola]TXK65952.1 dihydropteroate synthase [Alkalisalibacterium limincola]